MPQNRIQFQHGHSLAEFFAQYGTEEQCEESLEHRHWPAGFVCPVCGGQAHSTFYVEGRRYWQCSHCRTQTSLLSGTVFQPTKLPLTKWLLAEYLISQNKNNLSALSLKRHLGVSYRTVPPVGQVMQPVGCRLGGAMRSPTSPLTHHGVSPRLDQS